MPLSEPIILQLSVAIFLSTIIFVLAYRLPQKAAATALILLIPFQPVDTRYGTANVVLAFVVFLAMLMRERNPKLPLLPQILLVLFTYLVSMSFTHPSTYLQHANYIFYLVSSFLVLWIAYDLTFRFPTVRGIIDVFLIMNVLVVIYCFIQLAVGPEDKLRLFGRDEFSMMPLREDRLTGPFGGVGVAAEYFVIMIYLIAHQVLTDTNRKGRHWLVLLAGTNLALLVATGNRGGFLTLLGAGILFLWMFRHLLGTGRTLRFALVGTIILSISAAITINYTDFDRLFDRLTQTEIREGIPDTRSVVWPMAWEAIKQKPIFGNGPRLSLMDAQTRAYKDHIQIFYPHNLYLFLLFTVGIPGLTAFLIFLGTPLLRCWKLSRQSSDPFVLGYAKIGVLVMIIIFVDQIKVEFMRFDLVDYWHFVFALLGVLVAICERLRMESPANAPAADSRFVSLHG